MYINSLFLLKTCAMKKLFSRIKSSKFFKKPATKPSYELKEMSFLDHLEDLRWALIKAISGIVVATIVCSFFKSWIIDVVLMGPTYTDFISYQVLNIEAIEIFLQNRKISGQFFADWGTVFMVGIVVGSPFFVYQLWRFIEPGLYPTEKKGLRFASVSATFFFSIGILFGYFVISPLALQYFAHYNISTKVVNDFDLLEYFSMITFWSFGVGILFELPVVVFFLSKVGLVTVDRMRSSRRYVLIGVLIIGGFLTPPEPFTQVLVAIPLFALYEFSIYVVMFVEKRSKKKELGELGQRGLGFVLLLLQYGLWGKKGVATR